MKVIYRCEICGSESEDKSIIDRCEERGIAIPLVNEGDQIYFNDCKQTPHYYYEKIDFCTSDGMKKYINEAHTLLNCLLKYTVEKVFVRGHDVEYWLMLYSEKGTPVFRRILYGNGFMSLILEIYNKELWEKS